MPGTGVKDWRKYHALRDRGYSKVAAAKITNASTPKRRKRKRKT